MTTRRTVLIGSIGVPLLARAALAKGSSNAGLLKLTLSLNKTTVPLDGDMALICTLEARRKFCRVYAPVSWGGERGIRLKLVHAGKSSEPSFHPPGPPIAAMFNDGGHFRELDVGESASFRTTVKAKDLFAEPGSYELSAIYVPEPNRAFTKVQDAIVFENGPVESGAVRLKVV